MPAKQQNCPAKEKLEPCTVVIFGASGDLTTRKLMPALFGMYRKNSLPKAFNIVGCGRTVFEDRQFREMLRAALAEESACYNQEWQAFSAHLYYRQVVYDEQDSYVRLADFLQELDKKSKTQGNRIFDLSVPPHLYPVISQRLGRAGLSREGRGGRPWSRIVIEKPFGRDLQTACELQDVLQRDFREEQIFRIDHYLAKETVQNILTFRFANAIFEPLWNRRYIDYIGIMAAEDLGVGRRAGYYDQAGVLRDMFQNHMLQLLALTAMEPPAKFEAGPVRDEKYKVFNSLRQLADNPGENLILGQYGPGRVDGKPVAGYRQEPGVGIDSLTPTFAMMRLFVENWRWQGVPFYLISGKRLRRKETKIVVQFKKVPHTMFHNIIDESISANRLILGIYPNEEIKMTFQAKQPGPKVCLNTMTMEFQYDKGSLGAGVEAYEKVLLDCMIGDHMLFWRQDGVRLAWSLLTPILNDCETCQGREQKLYTYPAGSRGPEAAMAWLDLVR